MKEEILKKLLKKTVMDFAGPESERLVDLLYQKQNVNEFLIAKKLDLTINQTRNMLYKLGDQGLVGFIRKKDKKKGGWYTYFWTLKAKKSLFKFKEKITENLKNIERKLKSLQTEHHFYCKNCEIEYNEENAMLQDYTCPECGEVLEMKDATDTINHLKNQINKANESLKQISQEIEILEAKEEKSKQRRLKIELKKKQLEREKRKKEREREKKKAQKGKKPKKKPKAKKKTKKKPKKKKTKKPFKKKSFIKRFSKKKKKKR